MSVVASRVRDARKPVTSTTAAHQAIKARETLQTAREILRSSGRLAEAHALTPVIGELHAQVSAWYKLAPCETHHIRRCTICRTADGSVVRP